jgi:hypothetical protein
MEKSTVREFPSWRVRGGALPLSSIYTALEKLLGQEPETFAVATRAVADRAGAAVLVLERLTPSAPIGVRLQMWNETEGDYDEPWFCRIWTGRGQIIALRDRLSNAANRELRELLHEALCMATDQLAAGAVVLLN